MAAGRLNLTVEQGVDQEIEITWSDDFGVPVNLTGYAIRMQLRETAGHTKVWFDASTAAGTIVLAASEGRFIILVSASASLKIAIRAGVYDIKITDTQGKTSRLLEGRLTISPAVTR